MFELYVGVDLSLSIYRIISLPLDCLLGKNQPSVPPCTAGRAPFPFSLEVVATPCNPGFLLLPACGAGLEGFDFSISLAERLSGPLHSATGFGSFFPRGAEIIVVVFVGR